MPPNFRSVCKEGAGWKVRIAVDLFFNTMMMLMMIVVVNTRLEDRTGALPPSLGFLNSSFLHRRSCAWGWRTVFPTGLKTTGRGVERRRPGRKPQLLPCGNVGPRQGRTGWYQMPSWRSPPASRTAWSAAPGLAPAASAGAPAVHSSCMGAGGGNSWSAPGERARVGVERNPTRRIMRQAAPRAATGLGSGEAVSRGTNPLLLGNGALERNQTTGVRCPGKLRTCLAPFRSKVT